MDIVTNDIVVWDIVRVDFPFADDTSTRRRPALVIATPPVSAPFSIIWVLMITTASRGAWPDDVPVSDLAPGGLSRPCVVRTAKIAMLDTRLATRTGVLAIPDRVKVKARMHEILAHVLDG